MGILYSEPKNELNINDLYYDAMDLINNGRKNDLLQAEKILKQALAMDQYNVQTHIGLASVYGVIGNKEKAKDHIKIAYDQTVKKFPNWPKKMSWGDMNNRAYMRAIQFRADLHADEGEREKAVELYKLLLRLNPGDNQGVRYTLSGLYAGISGEEISKMFECGNKNQNWDELENLVKKQNAKHKFWKEPRY